MFVLLAVFILSIAFPYSNGHICLLDPVQRGGVEGYESANAPICKHPDGPCGGLPSGDYAVNSSVDAEITLRFMKNKNHWMEEFANITSWTLNLMQGNTLIHELYVEPDTNTPDLTIMNVTIDLAPLELHGGNYTLQLIYDTGRQPPEIYFVRYYYACTDIHLAPVALHVYDEECLHDFSCINLSEHLVTMVIVYIILIIVTASLERGIHTIEHASAHSKHGAVQLEALNSVILQLFSLGIWGFMSSAMQDWFHPSAEQAELVTLVQQMIFISCVLYAITVILMFKSLYRMFPQWTDWDNCAKQSPSYVTMHRSKVLRTYEWIMGDKAGRESIFINLRENFIIYHCLPNTFPFAAYVIQCVEEMLIQFVVLDVTDWLFFTLYASLSLVFAHALPDDFNTTSSEEISKKNENFFERMNVMILLLFFIVIAGYAQLSRIAKNLCAPYTFTDDDEDFANHDAKRESLLSEHDRSRESNMSEYDPRLQRTSNTSSTPWYRMWSADSELNHPHLKNFTFRPSVYFRLIKLFALYSSMCWALTMQVFVYNVVSGWLYVFQVVPLLLFIGIIGRHFIPILSLAQYSGPFLHPNDTSVRASQNARASSS